MANNPKNIDNLKPFKKGADERRNTAGYPKGVPHSKTRLLKLLDISQRVENEITGEIEEFTIIEQMDMAQVVKALKGDIAAYKELMDRLEGKSTNNVDVKSDGEKITGLQVEILRPQYETKNSE